MRRGGRVRRQQGGGRKHGPGRRKPMDKRIQRPARQSQQYKRGGKVRRQRGGRGGVRRQMGGRGRVRRQAGGNQSCGSNQHWMPPINGRPGYCMGGATHPTGRNMGSGYKRGGKVRRQRGGRTRPVRRQQGGPGSNLPTPWAGRHD